MISQDRRMSALEKLAQFQKDKGPSDTTSRAADPAKAVSRWLEPAEMPLSKLRDMGTTAVGQHTALLDAIRSRLNESDRRQRATDATMGDMRRGLSSIRPVAGERKTVGSGWEVLASRHPDPGLERAMLEWSRWNGRPFIPQEQIGRWRKLLRDSGAGSTEYDVRTKPLTMA